MTPELRALVDALCDETITPEQMQRLEGLLHGDVEAQAFYVQYMNQHAGLVRHLETRRSVPAPAAPAPRLRLFSRRTRVAVAALTAVAASLGLFLLFGPGPRQDIVTIPDPSERIDTTVAVLLQAPGAVWEGSPVRPGTTLSRGRIRLKSGFAHLEFYSGATVILEGPADFEILSASEAFCTRGKLRATVPPQAQGFTIRSPSMDVIDRGTEFGFQVGDDNKAEVHVFQGKVEWSGAGADATERKELTTGNAIRLHGTEPPSAIRPDTKAFQTAQDLAARRGAETRDRLLKWQAAMAELRHDPSLVLYYPFEPEESWSRMLSDKAGAGQKPHDGAIIGCTWVNGRWPGKQGLEFRRVSDRVRLHVPGEFESLTFMAWVRVDALPHVFNALFMTDTWEEGAPHWHIGQDGKLELGVQGRERKGGAHYKTHEIFTPERLGQWTHLAVVYDADSSKVIHYVDGQPVHNDPLAFVLPLRLGDAEIGNWNTAGRRHFHPVRYFNGCIDEFMLFSRAVGEEEMQQIFTRSQPPS
jgi:hypothetical protein